MRTVGRICERDVIFATRETTIQAAAKLMRHYHVGSLVIVENANGRCLPVGIVTDRDIVVDVNALDLDQAVITVGDIAAAEVATVREDADLLETIEIMRLKGVRRLPVVNAAGELVGIVSIDDLLKALTGQLTEMTHVLTRERENEVQARR